MSLRNENRREKYIFPHPQGYVGLFLWLPTVFLFTIIITFLRRISLGPEGMGGRDAGMMYF